MSEVMEIKYALRIASARRDIHSHEAAVTLDEHITALGIRPLHAEKPIVLEIALAPFPKTTQDFAGNHHGPPIQKRNSAGNPA
jgi:hypothetical protein